MSAFNFQKYKQARLEVRDLKPQVRSNPTYTDQMERIEEERFPSDFAQDSEDIYDDTTQPGFQGVGIFDDAGDIKGHLYGYELVFEDDLEDALEEIDISQVECFSQECSNLESFLTDIVNKAKNGEIFYVANLVVASSGILKVQEMLKQFVQQLRGTKYRYIAFDALQDSARLLFDESGVPKTRRLSEYGIEPVAAIPSADFSEGKVVLLSINDGEQQSEPSIWDKIRGLGNYIK